jgi:uncharacterized membrane protein
MCIKTTRIFITISEAHKEKQNSVKKTKAQMTLFLYRFVIFLFLFVSLEFGSSDIVNTHLVNSHNFFHLKKTYKFIFLQVLSIVWLGSCDTLWFPCSTMVDIGTNKTMKFENHF